LLEAVAWRQRLPLDAELIRFHLYLQLFALQLALLVGAANEKKQGLRFVTRTKLSVDIASAQAI